MVDFNKAVIQVKDLEKRIYTMLQMAIRESLSALSLDELLTKKSELGREIMSKLNTNCELIGIELSEAGLKDIILPGDMREIMNQVLLAEKRAQANIITRREETASTRSLLNTARLMEENEMLWKLKEMEFLERVTDRVSNLSVSGNGNILNQLREIFGR
ncbi:MAG TPA: slipin family protein [Saprospiraceae bacterium]|nr:slipin family protein [Saprospiraceae bacterium]